MLAYRGFGHWGHAARNVLVGDTMRATPSIQYWTTLFFRCPGRRAKRSGLGLRRKHHDGSGLRVPRGRPSRDLQRHEHLGSYEHGGRRRLRRSPLRRPPRPHRPQGPGGSGTGGTGGSPIDNPFPCLDPQPVANASTGFVACKNGKHPSDRQSHLPDQLAARRHRRARCRVQLVHLRDSDLHRTSRLLLHFSRWWDSRPDSIAMKGCVEDSECNAGWICVCGTVVGACVPAGCTSDARLPAEPLLLDLLTFTRVSVDQLCLQMPGDQCGGNADCATTAECSRGANGVRVCAPPDLCRVATVSRRPEQRIAEVEQRRDWTHHAPITTTSTRPRRNRAGHGCGVDQRRRSFWSTLRSPRLRRFTLQLLARGPTQNSPIDRKVERRDHRGGSSMPALALGSRAA